MRITMEAIETAYQKLSPKERANIDISVAKLEAILSRPDKPFGRLQALELIAKVGAWMVKNE